MIIKCLPGSGCLSGSWDGIYCAYAVFIRKRDAVSVSPAPGERGILALGMYCQAEVSWRTYA